MFLNDRHITMFNITAVIHNIYDNRQFSVIRRSGLWITSL